MTPPETHHFDDPTTGEIRIRLLEATETCRTSQATLTGTLQRIESELSGLKVLAQSIDGNLEKMGSLAKWVSGWTWKGALVGLAFLSLPCLLATVILLVVAGQADTLVGLVPGP